MGILDENPPLRVALRVAQMIVTALLIGVLVFLGVATYVTLHRDAPPTEPAVITYVLMAMALVVIVALAYVAASLPRRARRELAAGQEPRGFGSVSPGMADAGDAGRLFAPWQAATILRAASYEGGAFLCLSAAFVEGHVAALVGGAVMALLLAGQIPTAARLERHLESELAALAAERGTTGA